MTSTDETEALLGTDRNRGLDRKTVRFRRARSGSNQFFLLPHTDGPYYLKEILTQPAIILLFLLGVLFLIFDETNKTGLWLLLLTGFYALLVLAGLLFAGAVTRRAAVASRPVVRVIREGKLFLQDCIGLVPGDVIELEQGDLVPCDLRLVRCSGLRVSTYMGRTDGKDVYIPSFKDPDSTCMPEYENDIAMHKGMLYAGSRIEAGWVRAIVVETGAHTYIGALQGGFALGGGSSYHQEAQRLGQVASYIRLGLWVAVLPLSLICLWLGRGEMGLPTLFTTLLCLTAANLSGNLEMVLQIATGVGLYLTWHPTHGRHRALVKSEQSLQKTVDMDYLLLLGKHGLSDGRLHITDVFLPETDLRSGTMAQVRGRLLEDGASLLGAMLATPAGEPVAQNRLYEAFREGMTVSRGQRKKALGEAAPCMQEVRPPETGAPSGSLAASGTVGGRKVTVALTRGGQAAGQYRYMKQWPKGSLSLEGSRRDKLLWYINCMEGEGNELVTLAYYEDGEWLLGGVVTLSETFLPGRAEAIQGLRLQGICPVLFLEDSSSAERMYAIRSGMLAQSSADASEAIAGREAFEAAGRDITDHFGHYFVYTGFSCREIEGLVAHLTDCGYRVGVLANTGDAYGAFHKASVRFACSHEVFFPKEMGRPIETTPDRGTPQGDCATQQMVREAEILIPRAGCDRGGSGGLWSVLHTVRSVRHMESNMTDMAFQVLFSQVFRMILVLPLLLAGSDLVTPSHLLICGFGLDPMFALLFMLRQYPLSATDVQMKWRQKRRYTGYWWEALGEAAVAGVLVMVGFFLMAHAVPGALCMGPALYQTTLFTQLTAFLLSFRPISSWRHPGNRGLILTAVGLTGILSLVVRLTAGGVPSPFGYLMLMGPLAVGIVYFVVKLYMLGHFWKS